MALNPRLELRQKQKLALTPELRARLSVLRMSPAELDEELAREAARNPFLVVERALATGAQETDIAAMASAPPEPFQQGLLRQIERLRLTDAIRAAAVFLVAELDENGFLDTELPVLGTELSVPVAVLEAGLEVLQSCEPPGIAARNLRECLALQLVARGISAPEAQGMVRHLGLFADQNWATLARKLGLDAATVQARATLLRDLSPHPQIEQAVETVQYLRADLRLERLPDGQVQLVAATEMQAPARLDHAMIAQAREKGFAPELVQRAQALLTAIEQRGKTLERIGAWLVEKQRTFFETGAAELNPATRAQVAQDLGMHPSTIGRAIAGKAIDIEGRLYPIADFFSSALKSESGPVAASTVQNRIRELVAAEARGNPLSDDAITKLLRREGVDIARRTVAKYRQGLRIPSSAARRKEARLRQGK